MSKLFKRTLLLIIAIFVLLVLYAGFIEPSRLIVTEITVSNSNALEYADSIIVAVFADTHFSNFYKPGDFEKVITTINSKNPDIILFCGDLIDDYSTYEGDTEEIAKALSRLSATIGKFAVYGNHDHGGGAHRSFINIMESGGFQVLINETVEFEDIRLKLHGIDDFVLGRGNIEFIRENASNDYFNLVFSHVPDIVDSIIGEGVDLMVAAHTHGGQINIGQANFPSLRHIFFPPYGRQYTKGLFGFPDETMLYVNSGVAATIVPLRFMAPPEVTFFVIQPEKLSLQQE